MDYGHRGKLKTAWIFPTSVGVFAVIAALLAFGFISTGMHAQAVSDQYWKVSGPPCPSLSPQAFAAQAIKPISSFRMDGVVFARAYGYSSCGELPAKLGLDATVVCEFTNPGVVAVSGRGGEAYFAPGLGHPATVSVDGSGARCVLGANYKGD